MENRRTIVLVLRSGGDFSFRDVELIGSRILGLWKSEVKPRIILLWDKASEVYDLGNLEIVPLQSTLPGTWSRIQLYSPEMDQYRPFLYVDLDTAIIQSLENIFDLITDPSKFIVLEDFWQGQKKIATALVWFPVNSEKVKQVWNARHTITAGFRMDYFLRTTTTADLFWQELTKTIYDFKPGTNKFLLELPKDANIVCFHGKPRIFEATYINWINTYVNQPVNSPTAKDPIVTVIIPYKEDRGWLQAAIDSVPPTVQLLISQGEGNWPANFNKVLDLAKGKYIRWLHEDDMLTPNCIADSVATLEALESVGGVDFIHGNAIEISRKNLQHSVFTPIKQHPTLEDMLSKNIIHQTTLMYKREVFEKVGRLDESLNVMEEYEFNLRCLKAGLKIGYCNSTLAYYRRHDKQKVRVVTKQEKETERELVKSQYR